jgi:type II secretory pathway pseudopilin PulG
MVIGHSSIGAEFSAISIQLSAPDKSQSSALGPEPCNSSFNIHNSTFAAGGTASRLTPHALRSSGGFTILEIIIVLFLLVGLLGIILPRISLDENLGSVGRRMVGTVRSLQSLAMLTQKTVRLYVDMDRGVYWPVVLDGDQEKVPIDATWATPLSLPATIRFSDVLVSQGKKESGRVDLFFYPTGRIDPATMHLVDARNNILAIAIEPVTGAIRMSDERIEPPRPLTIPDRVRPLLQTAEAVR